MLILIRIESVKKVIIWASVIFLNSIKTLARMFSSPASYLA